MGRVCEICAKKTVAGGTIIRRGLAKKKGGIGTHVVKNNKRIFKPNLQTARVKIDGTVKTIKVCTACIRSGKIQKA